VNGYARKGDIYLEAKDYEKALIEYSKMIDIDPYN
jgi:hypothetical protein